MSMENQKEKVVQRAPNRYFISSSTGNDTNDGLTPETAWQTTGRVYSVKLLPGDIVSLKCGDSFIGEVLSITADGTLEEPIILNSYGTGAKPLVSGLIELDEMMVAANWTEVAPNIWEITSYAPSRLWLDDMEVLKVNWINSYETVGTINTEGVREYWNQINDKLYLYAEGNPAEVYHSIRGNRGLSPLYLEGRKHIVVDGLEFQGANATAGLPLSSYITVRNCSVGYGNFGFRIWLAASYITIENNDIDSGFRFKYGLGSDRGNNDGVNISDGHHCIVRNNVFTDWNHLAFTCVVSNTAVDTTCYHNKFYNNVVTAANISYGRAFELVGPEATCYDNEIYNNIFRHLSVRNQIGGNNNWIHHNIIDQVIRSDVKTDAISQAFSLSVYNSRYVCHDNKIDNNLFMNISEEAITIETYGGDNNLVRNNYVRNNIFYKTGLTPKQLNPGVAINLADERWEKLNTFSNNLVYNPGAPEGNAITYVSDGVRKYVDVAGFNALDQHNCNTVLSNLQQDPLFVDADAGDTHLQPTSPCIDTGMILQGLFFDFEGNPLYSGISSDIGIYEYQQ